MLGYIILGFAAYFLYRLVFGFVLPLWKSTKTVRENIRNMQQGQTAPASHTNTNTEEKIKTVSEKVGDYIDFEEIKEKK
ncbi:MAG TPA: hypothetical protein VGB84_09455 [Arachidicoccus sp.]